MSHLRLPAGTNEYIEVRVRFDRDAADPTTAAVEFALVDNEDALPAGGDWGAASWVTGGPPYYARKKYTGVAGLYRLWVRITTGDEVVVRPAGLIEYTAGP